jgi:choline dehydrogenase
MRPSPEMPTSIVPFGNHLPVRVRFGEGVSGELGDVVSSLRARTALVLVDAGLEQQNPGVAAAIAGLARAGVSAERLVKATGEPTIDVVDAATAALDAHAPEALVAVGGGSVIDTAKVARLCHEQRVTFGAWLESKRRFKDPALPLIAIPTTAGTGSEVSGGAVITDPRQTRKAGIADPSIRAQVALVDPLLTYSLPPAATSFTGVDALAQAIAAMIARVSTPIGDAIALEAIRMIGRSLPSAFEDGRDPGARAEMACASLMAGLAMNISDCTAEHSLAQAIGAVAGAPHGLTVGVVLAETLEREREHVPAVLERVADALGYPDDGPGDGSRAVRAVEALLAALDFPVLRSLGVEEDQLDTLTRLAVEDFFHTQSRVPWTAAELRHAFEAALATEQRAAGAPAF